MPIHVFIADASSDFLTVLQESFRQYPEIEVVGTACRGDEALDFLRRRSVDVLITDLLLPGLDGLSLLRSLRDENRGTNTIVVSAFVNVFVARSVSLLGVRDFLPKPFSMKELVSRVLEASRCDSLPVSRGFDSAIREALSQFSIPPNLNGRSYAESAIRRTLADHAALHGITKILYPDVAREFGTTAICVERSIRSAIIRGWERGSPDVRRGFFGDLFDGFHAAPSNAKFISAMVTHIELKFDSMNLLQMF